MVKFLDLHKQYMTIKIEIDNAISEVIASSAYIGGKYAENFEAQFSNYLNVNNCVGCGNGTDALEIAIEALELEPGSEVLVPGNSFIATSEAVTRSGHKVRFVDCHPNNYTIDLNDAELKINEKTHAIIPVHLYGHPADMNGINILAKKYNLFVIEDCAQAHGAEYNGKKVGGFGNLSVFSFYPGKNLGAYGDAGAICSNDSNLAARCRMIANHGRVSKYDHEFEGRNSRLDGLQAAVLSVKLHHLDNWLYARRKVAYEYKKLLSTLDEITLPCEEGNIKHAYHLFVIRASQRNKLSNSLYENGIGCGIHYPIALPNLQAYNYLNQQDLTPRATKYANELLSIPIGEHLSFEEVSVVVDRIKEFYQ